jgi:hypothetical protein
MKKAAKGSLFTIDDSPWRGILHQGVGFVSLRVRKIEALMYPGIHLLRQVRHLQREQNPGKALIYF